MKYKFDKRDIVFAAVIILLTAVVMLLPSKLGSKGTSPGYTALNAILLSSNCTDIIYEKYEQQAVDVLLRMLDSDLDFSGLGLWKKFIVERYGK